MTVKELIDKHGFGIKVKAKYCLAFTVISYDDQQKWFRVKYEDGHEDNVLDLSYFDNYELDKGTETHIGVLIKTLLKGTLEEKKAILKSAGILDAKGNLSQIYKPKRSKRNK